MQIRIKLKRRAGVLLGCTTLAAALGAAMAAVYVNVERLDIVDKKRSVAKTVTTVDRGAALNVIAKEGNWYKVDVAGQQGYVFAKAVSDSPGGRKGGGAPLSSVKSGSIPQLETAAAVKSVGDGAQQYASGSGLSTSGLQELIRRSEAITPTEFDQFLATGALRGAAAAPATDAPALASSK